MIPQIDSVILKLLKMINSKQIFIVGNSRSGTTMLGRILNNHSEVFTFKELHFFYTLWSGKEILSYSESINLLAKLFCVQDNSIFKKNNFSLYKKNAEDLISDKSYNYLELYAIFLNHITSSNRMIISCEQTPNNLYFLREILEFFPNARVVIMVRDQRDVLLSQKNKWKRKFLGATEIPYYEAVRAYFNYHPIFTSILWKRSLSYAEQFISNHRIMIVKFEDIISSPNYLIKKICHFVNINFQDSMLKVKNAGSSNKKDNDELMIDKTKIDKWKKGGLNNAEIYLSQIFSSNKMRKYSYNLKNYNFPPILIILYFLTLPIKFFLAGILNLNRVSNIFSLIQRRFF